MATADSGIVLMSLFVHVFDTRHMEMESDLWRANTLAIGVTLHSLSGSQERLLSMWR